MDRGAKRSWSILSRRSFFGLVGVGLGVFIGVGGYTFVYARGGSYLSDDAQACANCHVMRPQYEGWLRSSHRQVASCNDCHTPDPTLAKWATKGENGFYHSLAFTTGRFAEPIRIRESNRRVTEASCLRCHQDLVDPIISHARGAETSCVRCHASVGHAR